MVVGAETLLHEGMMFSVKGPMGKVLEMLAEGFHTPPEIRRLLFYPSFCSGSAGGSEESRGAGGTARAEDGWSLALALPHGTSVGPSLLCSGLVAETSAASAQIEMWR